MLLAAFWKHSTDEALQRPAEILEVENLDQVAHLDGGEMIGTNFVTREGMCDCDSSAWTSLTLIYEVDASS
jgi:hypothetical protein